jgi:hypothetical protein
LKNDPSWGKNFKVQFDQNTCRVNLQNIVPEIELPDLDSISVQIERAADIVEHIKINIPRISVNIPEGTHGKNVLNFRMNLPGNPEKVTEIKIDIDSIMSQNKNFSQKFFRQNKRGQFNMDSLISNFRSMIPDSMSYFNGEENRVQMKEFQREMKKFQQQMKNMEKELKKNKKEPKVPEDPVEI